MIKRVLALVIMAMIFSFNCEKGCGMPKKDDAAKEQPADGADKATEGADKAATDKAPATEKK